MRDGRTDRQTEGRSDTNKHVIMRWKGTVWCFVMIIDARSQGISKHSTVQWHYNAVNFLQNHRKRHPIAHPLGWDMGCLLWIKTYIHILPLSLQWCVQYHVILDHVIMALDCIDLKYSRSREKLVINLFLMDKIINNLLYIFADKYENKSYALVVAMNSQGDHQK